MFSLYQEENAGKSTMCSYHTYRRVFRSLNLSFHHPKKDQCSLCMTFLKGTDEQKKEIEKAFIEHTDQKNAARKKKKRPRNYLKHTLTSLRQQYSICNRLLLCRLVMKLLFCTENVFRYLILLYTILEIKNVYVFNGTRLSANGEPTRYPHVSLVILEIWIIVKCSK